MPTSSSHDRALSAYLKDRRSKLNPADFGLPGARRRTPGLRREEVAQRASISVTWYTWLEQGRGGAPSADVLDRISQALVLTDVEREHLFLLALGRAPARGFRAPEGISPWLQRVLDAMASSPAYVKTPTWDLLAWNRAANAVFGYDALQADDRNILRRIFCDPATRPMQEDWHSVARFVVEAFRAAAARAGASEPVQALVAELCRRSPEFEALWREHDVRAYGEGTKRLHLPRGGLLELEYSAFVVDGRPDLTMVVFNPVTAADANLVRSLMHAASASSANPHTPYST
ncbi:helix-turn-helix transcriptional regulator [soil metagenome]